MFKSASVYSSFSVDSLVKAKDFYSEVLGLKVKEEKNMGLKILLGNNAFIFVYHKEDHQPATFTILNFQVDDIDQAVGSLTEKGIHFEQYTGELQTDNKGIFRDDSGKYPSVAWFKDPAGNILALMQE